MRRCGVVVCNLNFKKSSLSAVLNKTAHSTAHSTRLRSKNSLESIVQGEKKQATFLECITIQFNLAVETKQHPGIQRVLLFLHRRPILHHLVCSVFSRKAILGVSRRLPWRTTGHRVDEVQHGGSHFSLHCYYNRQSSRCIMCVCSFGLPSILLSSILWRILHRLSSRWFLFLIVW